jgi:hypothetical protein
VEEKLVPTRVTRLLAVEGKDEDKVEGEDEVEEGEDAGAGRGGGDDEV